MNRVRVTIDVEKFGGHVTTSDICYAVAKVAGCAEAGDVDLDPLVGTRGRDGVMWGYRVEEVP
jgi:hypothetical protein